MSTIEPFALATKIVPLDALNSLSVKVSSASSIASSSVDTDIVPLGGSAFAAIVSTPGTAVKSVPSVAVSPGSTVTV